MPDQENATMGDLIRFPGTGQPDEPTDGATARVPAPRGEPEPTTAGTEPTDDHEATAGAELAVDTPRALQRRAQLPPALAGSARRVAVATRRASVATVRGTVTVTRRTAPYAGPAARFSARHGFYLLAGSWDLVCDGYKRLSHRDIDERIAAAQAAGEHGVAAQLMSQRMESKKLFIERIKVFGQILKYSPAAIAGIAAAGVAATLLTSVVAQFRSGGMTFTDVWTALFDGLAAVGSVSLWMATVGLPSLVTVLVAGLVVTGYNRRRRNQDAPGYLAPMGEGTGKDVVPDENAILQALKNLGLPPLNRQLKEGWIPRWTEPTQRDGRGWRTQLELPQGVTVEAINDKKSVLAHNLVRKPNEVWPTEPRNKPGVLDLWVADQGILDGAVDPWPLLHEGSTDFFHGVPVGIDARGDVVTGKLMACNYILGGTMGSGKTSLVINLLLGAMLDPLVEIDVHVMAFNADYDAMKPRLRDLVKGDEEEHIQAALDKLRELRDEVTTRGQLLEELGGEELKLTRELAERDARLRPRVVVVDECQELFEHDDHGEEAKKLAEKVAKKARKTGITLIWATPSPSASSLPRDLAKTASHRVCFAIGDHQGNDAVLGTGKHKAGITATGLVPGEDVGTAMASGFRREAGLLRCHHIRKEKGIDEQSPVVQRALALREDAGITAEATPTAAPVEQRDLLADLDAVLGAEAVPAADVPALLARHAPKWAPYQRLTGKKLREQLADEYGIKVPSTGNRYPVDPTTIRNKLAELATADLDEQE